MLETRAHRYADALRLARQIQTLRPGEPAGLALEGDLLVEQQRFSEAVAAYRKALALRQTGSLAIKLHAAQRRTGGANEADTALREWMNAHPEDLAAPLYMAEELGKNGKNQQAIEQYQNVLKRSPDNVVALTNIALIYQREKDPRAVRFAEQAFALAPHSPTTADTLGWILIEQGQTMRGAELLQRAAAMAPKNTEIRYHFAVALAKSGEKLKARKQVEDLLTSTPTFPQREAAETLLKQL